MDAIVLIRLSFGVFFENVFAVKYYSNLSDDKLVELLHRCHNRAAEGSFLGIIQIQLGRRGEGG